VNSKPVKSACQEVIATTYANNAQPLESPIISQDSFPIASKKNNKTSDGEPKRILVNTFLVSPQDMLDQRVFINISNFIAILQTNLYSILSSRIGTF